MVESIEQVISSIQEEFSKSIGELSDYEKSVIEKSIRLPFVKVFTSSPAMTDAIQSFVTLISELEYFKNRISSLKHELRVVYCSDYEKNYTILTRSGRPSRQAIESEMHFVNPKMSELRTKIEEYDILLDWLNSQIDILNISIRNYESMKYKL